MARGQFVKTIEAICNARGWTLVKMSSSWILEVKTPDGRRTIIFGYTFAVNSATALEICKEKPATSMVLQQCGVPAVEHDVVLNPSKEVTKDYLPKAGVWNQLKTFFERHGGAVLKPLKGTGGFGVERVRTQTELEGAVQRLFTVEYGLAAAPLLAIEDEYRVVCAFGAVKLIYRKQRMTVAGDGTSPLQQLLARELSTGAPERVQALATAMAQLSASELASTPAAGEEVALEWRHNLGLGAVADFAVPADLTGPLSALALQAMDAVGLTFGSVDMVSVGGELSVLEINIGVQMDNIIAQGKQDLAYAVYEEVLLAALKE